MAQMQAALGVADEQLGQTVRRRLLWDPRIDLTYLSVEVVDGLVILSGCVPSHLAREAAYQTARGVHGVADVRNRLAVRPAESACAPTDADIRWRVLRLLELHPDVDAAAISVAVTDGVITLAGTVDACWKKYHVEDLLGGGYGVAGVRNHLAVAASGLPSERAIADCIVMGLRRTVAAAAEAVSVEVARGTATLSGRVPTEAARQTVLRIARGVFGVCEVVDRLAVRRA